MTWYRGKVISASGAAPFRRPENVRPPSSPLSHDRHPEHWPLVPPKNAPSTSSLAC